MRRLMFTGLGAAALLATPLLAQAVDPTTGRSVAAEEQRGYQGVPSPNQAQVDAAQNPVTNALNTQADASAARTPPRCR